MRLVAFHLEQKQKSFSRFLNIFVAIKDGVFLFPKTILLNLLPFTPILVVSNLLFDNFGSNFLQFL